MTTIILADSDKESLGNLAGRLKVIRTTWNIIGLHSASDVLARVSEGGIDCVVTEMTLQDMSGFDLLSQLQSDHPEIIRIALSADQDHEIMLQSTRANHRFINREVSDEVLAGAVECSLRLHKLLQDDMLRAQMSGIIGLPSLPEIYQQMVQELTSAQSSLLGVARIIETDVGLTATVLKTVNSAFYGLNQPVESVSQGVALLGVHLIKNVTLTAKVFAQFEGNDIDTRRLRQLNDQANKTGALTNHFARLARVPRTVVDHTQIAGMLSNIGQLVAMSNKTLTAQQSDPAKRIQSELMGAYLLRMWLLPDPVVQAVALQTESPPQTTQCITPLLIVNAVRHLELNLTDVKNNDQLDSCREYLESIVSPLLAEQWIEAYSDLELLTEAPGPDQTRAA